MNITNSRLIALVDRARMGEAAALGELLEKHRPYLRFLAERQLDPRLDARIDASDIVQQTCLSVHRGIREFVGNDPAQFLTWLRQIHDRNIQNAFRDHVRLKKRSIEREQASPQQISQDWATARVSSPSQRLMLSEDSVLLTAALESLSEDQRTAIRLKFLEGVSLTEISQQLNRSPDAIVSLIRRGILQLQAVLDRNTMVQSCGQ